MRVGLAGSSLSADLGILKREIEDRGHRAVIFNPRKAPEYAFETIAASGAAATLVYDHRNLGDFDALYVGDLEGRDRFFRGSFDKDVWISLRNRYLSYAGAEVDALAFQISLLLAAARTVPAINSAESILATRLRPYVYWRALRAGLPVWPFEPKPGAPDGALAKRVRTAEETCCDVPCFPRGLKHTLSMVAARPDVTWTMIRVTGAGPGKMMVAKAGEKRVEAVPAEAAALADRLLGLFGLTAGEVHLAPEGHSLGVLDVSAFPRLAEFDEATGERSAALVAEALLKAGGPH